MSHGGYEPAIPRHLAVTADYGSRDRGYDQLADLGRGAMNEETSESTEPVVDAVVRASRALVGITVRALNSVSDEVTLPQLRTLVVVSLQGPQTVSALAERLDVHASTMTRMCNRLVTRGLVARTPSALDRREVVIELSPQGQGLVDAVMDKRRREIDAVV